MNYTEAIAYLQNLTKFGFNFGLERINELMRRLGNPHQKLKVVHIGGTNGKGSTSAILAAILQAAGYKVGMFTSPHLHSYTERYRINGQEVGLQQIAKLITMVKPLLEEMVSKGFEHPTEFEVSTALAFQYFYEEEVDILILEVGLGGLIDSTNVVEPLISVITNVAMDHMDYLGNSIEEITQVKAGIIKAGRPVITAAEHPIAQRVIQEVSDQNQAPLTIVGRDVTWQGVEKGVRGQVFNYHGQQQLLNLYLPLLGDHQLTNASAAITIALTIQDQGYAVDESAIRLGLEKTLWPGRLEIVQQRPLVVVDGAHNLDGAQSLARSIRELFNYQKLIMVVGMLGDKEREKVVEVLAPLADKIVVTRPNSPRAGEWQQIAEEAAKFVPEVYLEEDVHKAVRLALELASPEDMVCITGSLYMIAEAREHWRKEAKL